MESPSRALVSYAAVFPAGHGEARGEVETAGPDTRDNGGLGLAGAEGDNGEGEADESDGGVVSVEEVLVEVLGALASADELRA